MSCEQTPEPTMAGDCGPCSPARRNRYFPDKRMTSADYRLEQTHLIERRRLINRAMLGSGIVQGFAVSAIKSGGVCVGTGVALDSCGRELVACKPVELAAAGDVLWLGEGECGREVIDPPEEPGKEGTKKEPRQQRAEQQQTKQQQTDQTGTPEGPPEEQRHHHYLLCAHYAEQPIDGIRVDDGCGSAKCEANHLCETVVYSLMCVDGCPPGLRNCLQSLWDKQDCPSDDAHWDPVAGTDEHPRVAKIQDRGTHEQLVQWSIERLKHVHFCKPCKTEQVGGIHVDLDACVPLACVEIGFRCGEAYIARLIDDWRPKRLARPNNILFDLIRGCDLVRIQNVGWRDWLEPDRRRISFSDFADMFIAPRHSPEVPRNRRRRGPRPASDTRFWVCFSGPVQISSLTTDVIAITLVQRDVNEEVGNVVRVPITAIAVAPTTEGDPDGTTRAFRPMVSGRFWEGEINPNNVSGFETETRVEIEVRTAFILDVLGQEVAGGGRFVPTSGCTPGGRFLSTFTVVPDEDAGDFTAQQSAPTEAEEA